MRTIPLATVPGQSLTVTIDNVRYALTIKAARGTMVCDIAVDGVTRVTGSRVLAGEMLIPYEYMETGNFLLLTEADDLPDYTLFGVSQTLVFLTPAELEAIRS